jgi:AraC-like DNA-binding protein/quercetin dioxygenase-like cupin family protein
MNPEHDYFFVAINPSPSNNELAVLFSGEGQTQSLHKMGPAIHDYYLIHTVLAGEGSFTIQDKQYHCAQGDSFVIFPGELFSYQADEDRPWRYTWVAFVGDGAASLLATIGVSAEEPIISGSLDSRIRSYYEQLQGCFPVDADAELSNLAAGGWLRLLLQWFGLAKRRHAAVTTSLESTIDYVMKQAIQFLSHHYAQPISIEQLSAMLGYHRTHLCKLFKHSTGVSPMQYLLRIRMSRAEQLLATPMPIDQVASSVGFGDALYFSRKFRKWRGQSPSEYRKTLRSYPKRLGD